MTALEKIRAKLSKIKEREQKATKGPWVYASDGRVRVIASDLICPKDPKYVLGVCVFADEPKDEDAIFMAASRTDVPNLLAALECTVEEIQHMDTDAKNILRAINAIAAILEGKTKT